MEYVYKFYKFTDYSNGDTEELFRVISDDSKKDEMNRLLHLIAKDRQEPIEMVVSPVKESRRTDDGVDVLLYYDFAATVTIFNPKYYK